MDLSFFFADGNWFIYVRIVIMCSIKIALIKKATFLALVGVFQGNSN